VRRPGRERVTRIGVIAGQRASSSPRQPAG